MVAKQNNELQEINEQIYKRNLELAVVNKTLSLLRKLYQISLQALDPASLSEKIAEAVRTDLNMELVGVFKYDESADSLAPFKFSYSARLGSALAKFKPAIHGRPVATLASHALLRKVVIGGKPNLTAGLQDVFSAYPDAAKIGGVASAAHLKSVMLYPLAVQNRNIGMIALGLNRAFSELGTHEQETVRSVIDVVAVALDNTLLYEKLQDTNKQLRILDQARAEFISIASHQLRTPPATVKWYLAAVLGGDYGKLPPHARSAVEKAQYTNEGLIGLIDDMLNASRIERGKMEFIFEPTDYQKLVSDTVMQLAPQAAMKKLKLTYDRPKGSVPKILADKEKLQQVVNNLIDNAIKYSKSGTIRVSLSKGKDDLVMRVKDSGRGLAKPELTAIFEKYGRGKDSQRQASGLGLGLYVAKIVTEYHKGRIWAESKGLGKGSVFVVSLPIKADLKADTLDLTKSQQ